MYWNCVAGSSDFLSSVLYLELQILIRYIDMSLQPVMHWRMQGLCVPEWSSCFKSSHLMLPASQMSTSMTKLMDRQV